MEYQHRLLTTCELARPNTSHRVVRRRRETYGGRTDARMADTQPWEQRRLAAPGMDTVRMAATSPLLLQPSPPTWWSPTFSSSARSFPSRRRWPQQPPHTPWSSSGCSLRCTKCRHKPSGCPLISFRSITEHRVICQPLRTTARCGLHTTPHSMPARCRRGGGCGMASTRTTRGSPSCTRMRTTWGNWDQEGWRSSCLRETFTRSGRSRGRLLSTSETSTRFGQTTVGSQPCTEWPGRRGLAGRGSRSPSSRGPSTTRPYRPFRLALPTASTPSTHRPRCLTT
mmetsp:Transcript_36944/g.89690  ORF Transcript_36944/g.89690 Transcript_36944/m.89690 type:complete len:283 (+) Transcript_36944:240-1088(+)